MKYSGHFFWAYYYSRHKDSAFSKEILALLREGEKYYCGGIMWVVNFRCQNCHTVNDHHLLTVCTVRSQQVLTTRLVYSPSYKIRILVIDFTELKLNIVFIVPTS